LVRQYSRNLVRVTPSSEKILLPIFPLRCNLGEALDGREWAIIDAKERKYGLLLYSTVPGT
jgi:hypothetical protein